MSIRRKRRLRSKLRLAVFVLLLIGLFTGGFVAANNYLWPIFTGEDNLADVEGDDPIAKLPSINVLMMAVDERDGDKSLLTDTMILANINNKDNRVSLLSIPRDTKVSLPGHGVNKINAASVYGGPEMAMETVSDLVGMPVDYYILTNFNGFKDIVDALGGVTVDVEKNMNHHENAYGGAYDIFLSQGVQKLDGDHALMYARWRGDELGDITRTQRQQKLLTAIADETLKPGSIIKLPKLIPQIQKNVETNMGLKQMLALAQAGSQLNNIHLVTQTMPGWFLDEHGVSYWYVDPKNAKDVARSLFEDGKVMEVVQGAMTDDTPKHVAMEQPRADGQEQKNAQETAADTTITTDKIPDAVEPIVGSEDRAYGDDGDGYDGDLNGEQQPPDNASTNTPTLPEETSEHVEIIINTFP